MNHVLLVKESYDAFARDDMDTVLAHVHPDIVWHQAQGLPHGGVYHGVDQVRRNVFDPLDRDWWTSSS
jgi:ketosteroid isomerase-like protein